jgi:hypothetical protein
MDEGPEREASAKLAQHLAVAVQIAEAVIRMRQQQTERKAADTEQAAAAVRAGTTAQHTADRVVFSQALNRKWTANADLRDLGRAWGAAAGWADTDPMATVAATRVEDRLSEMAPAAMARFTELRESGTDRIDAMRDVLANVAAESSYRPRVFVAEPGQTTTAAGATAGQHHSGTGAKFYVYEFRNEAEGTREITRAEALATIDRLPEDAQLPIGGRGDLNDVQSWKGRDPDVDRAIAQKFPQLMTAAELSAVMSSVPDPQARADTAAFEARVSEATPDDPHTRGVDEHAEGVAGAVPREDERAAFQADADTAAAMPATERQVGYILDLLDKNPSAAGDRPTGREAIASLSRADASDYITALGGGKFVRRTTEAGYPHPADVAAESFPHPYTEVTPAAAAKTSGTAAGATKAKTRTLSR